jgi:quercetin dioxygenase-like cupin family protein
VLEGKVTIEIADGPPLELRPGDLASCRPDVADDGRGELDPPCE